MAGRREANPNYRPDEPGRTRSTNLESDNLDALVSSFLAELNDISSDMQQNGLPADTGEFVETEQAVMPELLELQKSIQDESSADLERISNEVESALIELERSKSNGIPIADRKEPGPVRSSAFGGNKMLSAAKTAGRERAKSTMQVADTEGYQGWAELEALRNKVGSPGLVRKRRIVLLALTVTLLAIILGYFYFFRANRSAPIPAAAAPAQANKMMSEAGKAESESGQAVAALPAEALVKVPPVYPKVARTQKGTGAVELVAHLNKKGDVIRTEFLGGSALLRDRAEKALLKWRVQPASVNGANIPSQVLVRMVFSLK